MSLYSVLEYIDLLDAKKISPEELAVETASRIRALDSLYNSFLSVAPGLGHPDFPSGDGRPDAAMGRPLAGIPFAVKDLFFTEGLPTTAGSRAPIPAEFRDRIQGEAINRLLEAGAVLAGKNNLHEFAFGITNENDHFGPVLNPWDITRVSGGSSGGSAAAVAAGLVPFALGTDTRGSIRIPSSCCGVTGLKPTYGRVPVSGLVPLSKSLDHAGPITRTVEDAELIFKVLADLDTTELTGGAGLPMRMGLCRYYFSRLDREVAGIISAAVDSFRLLGTEVVDVEIPLIEESFYASDVVSRAEGFAFHRENLLSFRKGYGESVAERLGSGREIIPAELAEALRIKKEFTDHYREAFRRVDCLLAPTLPVTAVMLGVRELNIDGHGESIVQGFTRLNAPQNMAGVPSLSLPCGFDSGGLPVGLQLVADWGREDLLFRAGKLFQSATDWHLRVPGLGKKL